jgi:hypothetical protein
MDVDVNSAQGSVDVNTDYNEEESGVGGRYEWGCRSWAAICIHPFFRRILV